MIVILCVDDNGGTMFNHRRQSQDRLLRDRILRLTAGTRLWMNHYSAKQFAPASSIYADDHFLDKAAPGEYCFVENSDVLPYEQSIEKIILYQWNRRYPADHIFNIPRSRWRLVQRTDFPGSSHERITEEVYSKTNET